MVISKALVAHFVAMAATTLLVAGCASKEEPATQAVITAEASLAEVRVDAAKYAPEELKVAEAKLAKLRTELANDDFKDVLSGSSQLTQEVATLKEVVVSKQTQDAAATHEWESLSSEVPKMVEAIESRVDTLSESRKLPAEVNKESFEAAKVALESMKTTWAEASAAFDAGNATEAADKGRLVQAKAAEVAGQLGISPV